MCICILDCKLDFSTNIILDGSNLFLLGLSAMDWATYLMILMNDCLPIFMIFILFIVIFFCY